MIVETTSGLVLPGRGGSGGDAQHLRLATDLRRPICGDHENAKMPKVMFGEMEIELKRELTRRFLRCPWRRGTG
jgi:hypothetical protein